MKRTISSFILVLFSIVSLHAQDKKNYQGDVSIGGVVGLDRDFGSRAIVQTIHGVRYEGGAFVGAGVGAIFDSDGNLEMPLFGTFRQSFSPARKLKPHVGASTGVCLNDSFRMSLYFAPEVGLQIGAIKFFVNYSFYDYREDATLLDGGQRIYSTSKSHRFGAGIGIIFGKK